MHFSEGSNNFVENLQYNELHIKTEAYIKINCYDGFFGKLALYIKFLRGCKIIHYIMLTKQKLNFFVA